MNILSNCKYYLIAINKGLEKALISEIDIPTVTYELPHGMWTAASNVTKLHVEGYVEKMKEVNLSRPIKEISDEELVDLIMKEG